MNITLASVDHSNVEEQNTRWLGSRKADLLAARGIRGVLIAIVAGVLLGSVSPSHVFAKSGKQAGSDNAPAIDPSAMQALDKMGAYLRTLHSFQVKADMTTDDVLEDGEAIQSSSTVDLVASRPNRLRAEFVGDDGHRFFFFDGKNFTIYGQITNYYATVPAPPTITELIQKLGDKYAIQLPLVDLFEWGTTDSDINKIKAAQDVGPSAVDGVTCEQYAFRQENLDWQVWIQMGEFPLPRKIVIRTLTDDAKPQHTEVLSWNLAPSFSDDAFTFDPPPDAKRIKIAEVKGEPAEGNQ
jgi:hypothetical protein